MGENVDHDDLVTLFRDDCENKLDITKNTTSLYKMDSDNVLTLEIVGFHPLWGHHIWNSSTAISKYIETHQELVDGKIVLELGAGAGLPSIVSSLCGAKLAVATEYPDDILISTLNRNLSKNCVQNTFKVAAFRWGDKECIKHLLSISPDGSGYDIIIMSDLLFNHSQHIALLKSCSQLLGRDKSSAIYCVFSHHIPAKAKQDMKFFSLAQHEPLIDEKEHVLGYGEYDKFKVKLFHSEAYKPMFEKDSGDINIRSTVFFYKLTRVDTQ